MTSVCIKMIVKTVSLKSHAKKIEWKKVIRQATRALGRPVAVKLDVLRAKLL